MEEEERWKVEEEKEMRRRRGGGDSCAHCVCCKVFVGLSAVVYRLAADGTTPGETGGGNFH